MTISAVMHYTRHASSVPFFCALIMEWEPEYRFKKMQACILNVKESVLRHARHKKVRAGRSGTDNTRGREERRFSYLDAYAIMVPENITIPVIMA